jgi:hypothetical protein
MLWTWLHRKVPDPAINALIKRMGRGLYLSTSLPVMTLEIPKPMRKAVYPDETRARLQSKVVSRDLKKTPKVHIASPRVTVAAKHATTTNHP